MESNIVITLLPTLDSIFKFRKKIIPSLYRNETFLGNQYPIPALIGFLKFRVYTVSYDK